MAFNYGLSALQISLSHPVVGSYVWNGGQGNGSVTISPLVDPTVQEVTPDGATINNFILGSNANFSIQTQQISDLTMYLVSLHKYCVAQGNLGILDDYAGATGLVVDTISGLTHTMQGICPSKIPDISYGAQTQMVTWLLKVSNLVTE